MTTSPTVDAAFAAEESPMIPHRLWFALAAVAVLPLGAAAQVSPPNPFAIEAPLPEHHRFDRPTWRHRRMERGGRHLEHRSSRWEGRGERWERHGVRLRHRGHVHGGRARAWERQGMSFERRRVWLRRDQLDRPDRIEARKGARDGRRRDRRLDGWL
jgi:hypothetical protein